MDTNEIKNLIDKVIGKEGALRTPAYWMRRVLNALSDVGDRNTTELQSVNDSLVSIEAILQDVNKHLEKAVSDISFLKLSIPTNYLTFVPAEDGFTAKLSSNACEYRIDGGEWVALPANTETPAINVGQSISFRANITPVGGYTGIGSFTLSAPCRAEGTPMSLLYGDDATHTEVPALAFTRLFNNQPLLSVSKGFLPATTLASSCYSSMFNGCTSLVNAPALPATTLTNYCYSSMFNGCTSLVNAPELPATKLSGYCYNGMFRDCKSLVNAPALPATKLADSCYDSMFNGCTSLVNVPELPATTLIAGCYYMMFAGCTRLVTAPELPATTLAEGCYGYMFAGCASLVNAPALPATTLADSCYSKMFQFCKALVTAPELPTTTLIARCYDSMFYGCTSLSYIKAMFLTEPSSLYTSYWVDGVASTGTFVKNAEATWDVVGVNGVLRGWTIEYANE